jgi:signal transduction histidine kinase
VTGPGPSSPPPGRTRFLEWAESLDPGIRRAYGGPLGWLAAAVGYTALIGVASTPRLAPFFRIDPVPVVALQLLSLGASLVYIQVARRRGLTASERGWSTLALAFLFQLALSSTVTYSQPPGAFAWAALPLIGACFHGYLLRPTRRHLYPVVAHGLGMAAALALRPDAVHVILFVSVAPLVLGGSLVSGFISARLAEQQQALEGYRSAIHAQVLAARRAEVEQLSDVLERAVALGGEARAILRDSLCEAEALAGATRAEVAGAMDLRTRSRALRDGVRRLAERVESIRQLGRDVPAPASDLEPVAAFSVASDVVGALRERYPHVALSCRATSRRAELAAAAVGGGSASLRRILENVVANACEGDGARGARAVELTVAAEPEVRLLAFDVRDDGPGFPAALLASSIAPFVTTKPSGSGLGLYTAERLARASGGLLRRENTPGGGARVAVFLPEASGA